MSMDERKGENPKKKTWNTVNRKGFLRCMGEGLFKLTIEKSRMSWSIDCAAHEYTCTCYVNEIPRAHCCCCCCLPKSLSYLH